MLMMRLALTGWGATPLVLSLFLVAMRELDTLKGRPRTMTYRWVTGIALGIFVALSVAEVLLQVTALR